MSAKLDLKGRKILYELDVNCRQSNSQIAKKVGLSKDVVNYRIKKLEEQGIITDYRAIIDLSKLGFFTFRAYLKLQDTYKEKEEEIISFLKQHKPVWWLGKLAGRFDLVFAYWTKSHREFYDFWMTFLKKYRKYIHHEQISTFIEYIHFRKAYLLNLERDESGIEIVGGGEKTEYDNTNWKILSLLARNARIPLLKIAKETKLTAMAVNYRIKQLQNKKIIQGYRALIDFTKLDYEYYKVDMFLEDITQIKTLQAFCKSNPNIVYIDRTIGGGDIEFDLEVKNLNQFYKILEELKEKFKGLIRTFEFFSVLKIYKTLYFPE
jgi:Lrp/AsnC family transcriptional regulator for asnA, asnC and gidA